MKPRVDDVPSKLENYHSIKKFIDTFDQLEAISSAIGDNYRSYLNNNWENAIEKYKSNESIVYPWQELIMILLLDYYYGPYLGIPEPEKVKFYTQILDRLKLEL